LQYAFEIKPHANARYALSMDKLALIEMQCLLHALDVRATVVQAKLAGTRFILIETEPIDERGWRMLSGHSGVSFAALKDGDWLKPLQLHQAAYMGADLAQVLKYKGKTNADFTLMMLHCAKAASTFALSDAPLTVLDPLCGCATTLFCALQEGNDATGVEIDKKAVHEADTYFKRYLRYHRYKHKRETYSATLPEGGHAEEIRYRLASDPDTFKAGGTRSFRLFHGGAAAVSFNTYTLKRKAVCEALENAGLTVQNEPPFDDFSHWVEQAVNRDMVIAVKA
jgi:hypothetical protein